MKEELKNSSYLRTDTAPPQDGVDYHAERQWARSNDLGISSPARTLTRSAEAGIIGNIQRVREAAADPIGLKNVPKPFNTVRSRTSSRMP